MTAERLNELQALCDAASDPTRRNRAWTVQKEPAAAFRRFTRFHVEQITDMGCEPIPICLCDSAVHERAEQVSAFIAAARTALPELIARVRELEAALQEQRT